MSPGRTLFCAGAMASLGSAVAVAVAARVEGRAAIAPVNATSHWLQGPAAGAVEGVDAPHTLVGFGTHVASAFFWAVPFAAWLEGRSPRTFGDVLVGAGGTAAAAAALDYGLLPRRVSPGWELVVSRVGVAAGFVGLALGLAAGGWMALGGDRSR